MKYALSLSLSPSLPPCHSLAHWAMEVCLAVESTGENLSALSTREEDPFLSAPPTVETGRLYDRLLYYVVKEKGGRVGAP